MHGVGHVPTLDIWWYVLRGNVPGHRLSSCEYVGPMRTSGPLRGVYVTLGPICDFGQCWPMCML